MPQRLTPAPIPENLRAGLALVAAEGVLLAERRLVADRLAALGYDDAADFVTAYPDAYWVVLYQLRREA